MRGRGGRGGQISFARIEPIKSTHILLENLKRIFAIRTLRDGSLH